MQTMLKNMLLAASLATLTVPVVAQATSAADSNPPAHQATVQPHKKHPRKRIALGPQSGKLTAGEAASLERKEGGLTAEDHDMGEDNRGRLTAAGRAHLQHQRNATVVSAHATNAAGPRTQPRHAAELKTGQLTTRQSAHLATKETALHHQSHSDREPHGQPTPEDGAQTNQIRLKKHNARMF